MSGILYEFHASDVDARVNSGFAVLAVTTEEGRVAISMPQKALELLALRIQLELARAPLPAASRASPTLEAAWDEPLEPPYSQPRRR